MTHTTIRESRTLSPGYTIRTRTVTGSRAPRLTPLGAIVYSIAVAVLGWLGGTLLLSL